MLLEHFKMAVSNLLAIAILTYVLSVSLRSCRWYNEQLATCACTCVRSKHV
jgi:hypothetical protein